MNIIDYFILVVAILLVIIVMLQNSKDDINDAFTGGKSELFKNQKARGAELFLERTTAVLAGLFFILIIVSSVIMS